MQTSGTLTNTATLNGNDGAGNVYTGSSSATVTVSAPEASMVKSVSPTGPQGTGTTLTYSHGDSQGGVKGTQGYGISVEHDGTVLRIRLDRPEKLNAVDTPMLDELSAHIRSAETDESTRAVQLSGAGRGFCSGGDLTGGIVNGVRMMAQAAARPPVLHEHDSD